MSNFATQPMLQGRDPGTAALLSIVPGLGQLYNGDSRKGILFLDVAFINAALLVLIFASKPITESLKVFASQYHMELNGAVIKSISHFGLGSPASLVVLGLVLSFAAYAVRDAYDNAVARRRKAIYSDMVLGMSEAASGSYIMHASTIVALAVLALFFMIPPTPKSQILDIEIVAQEPTYDKPNTKTKIISNNPSQAHGRHDPEKRINHQPPKTTSTSSSRAQEEQSPPAPPTPMVRPQPPAHAANPQPAASQPAASQPAASQPAPPVPVLRPALRPSASQMSPSFPSLASLSLQHPSSRAPIAPAPQAMKTSAPAPQLPTAVSPAAVQAQLLPSHISAPLFGKGKNEPSPVAGHVTPQGTLLAQGLPSLASPVSGLSSGNPSSIPSFRPQGQTGPQGASSFAPGPLKATEGGNRTGTTGGPAPVSLSGPGNRTVGESGSGPGPAPAPTRAGRGTGTGPSSSGQGPADVVPTTGNGISNHPVNNASSHDDQPQAVDAVPGAPDFSKYMTELQRKIKRNWFPPKHYESKRVQLRFKIHTSGTLSNLHVVKSSGYDIADAAAIKAVENAAPFLPLPKHSPEAVDIEFTFDYNVFSGQFR